MAALTSERERRASNTEKVIALLRANPGRWLHWRRFERVGGACAWRTRISDARKVLKAEGALLEHNGSVTRSAYRYSLGRDPQIPVPEVWPVFDAPYREPFRLT